VASVLADKLSCAYIYDVTIHVTIHLKYQDTVLGRDVIKKNLYAEHSKEGACGKCGF
jgi:hypothetical protein